MKKLALFFILFAISILSFAQQGPGGVGSIDGTSSLKIWIRTDAGVTVSGSSIDAISNSAGIAALDISETAGQRPTLVANAVNGYDEISFSGSNRLRTGLNLTTTNFITNQASSFVVCRADNTSQTSCVYTTDPLVGTTRFSCHTPWSNTVYYDMGTCCSNDARLQVGSLTGLNTYSVWSYDANAADGKQLYRNGTLLQSRANILAYSSHASQRFNIGGNTSGTNGFVGDVTEVIIYNQRINQAQRIIVENYLAAKFGLSSTANDVFKQDDAANGNYDHDVAGIGRVNASNIHNDAQGTGILRILNPTNLGNNEFLMWGHDNGLIDATETIDVPTGVQARMNRVWRFSELNATGTAVDVGSVDVQWDLTGLGPVILADLSLLIDSDNDGQFANETPITGATDLGSNIYSFTGISGISDGTRFTLGTSNASQTPLPIELIYFSADLTGNMVDVKWTTAIEVNNSYFEVQRSMDGLNFSPITTIEGAGNSNKQIDYLYSDEQPIPGVSYYRLKQSDFDGKYTYSETVQMDIQNDNNSNISIYPNPAKDVLIVMGLGPDPSGWHVSDVTQKLVEVAIIRIEEDKMILDTSPLTPALYLFHTASGTFTFLKE